VAVAQELQINPANKDQRIIVWSNGWLQPLGGATAPAQAEARFGEPPVAPAAPTFYESQGHPVAAAKVTTWGSSPAGYTMDIWGAVWNWGGAGAVTGTFIPNVWLTNPVFGYYADFVMNPAANGQGYAVTYDGDVLAMGTGTPAITHSPILAAAGSMALRLYMDWTSKRYWVLDNLGRWWGMNGGNNLAVGGLPPLGTLLGPTQGLQFAGELYNMAAAAQGWHMNQYGQVDPIGGATAAPGHPGVMQYRIYQDVRIISQSSPIRLALLNEYGGIFEYNASTAPTVAVVQPAATQTTTSRPVIGWTVSDVENDAVTSWDFAIANSTQYGIGGFDPWASPMTYRITGQTSSLTRSLQSPVDLPNATYRAYVRVTDASGLTSTTANIQWIQNVTRPATPTVTPTVLGALTGISLALHVNPAGLPANTKFGLQYQDADDATWRMVKGGWDVTPNGSGDATVVDHGAGFGIQRTYRVIAYVYDATTDTWNAGDFSSTANATITDKTKWVLSTADNSDSMVVKVNPNFKLEHVIKAGVFWPVGRQDPIVIRDGVPKYQSVDMSLWVLDNATRTALEAIIQNQTLLLRDPFGRRHYIMLVQSYEREPLHAGPLLTETTPLRDANVFNFHVQRVARPRTGPTSGPLAAAA